MAGESEAPGTRCSIQSLATGPDYSHIFKDQFEAAGVEPTEGLTVVLIEEGSDLNDDGVLCDMEVVATLERIKDAQSWRAAWPWDAMTWIPSKGSCGSPSRRSGACNGREHRRVHSSSGPIMSTGGDESARKKLLDPLVREPEHFGGIAHRKMSVLDQGSRGSRSGLGGLSRGGVSD